MEEHDRLHPADTSDSGVVPTGASDAYPHQRLRGRGRGRQQDFEDADDEIEDTDDFDDDNDDVPDSREAGEKKTIAKKRR